MRKKALAALLAAAMLAVTGCSGMPGMGTTNAPATKAGDEMHQQPKQGMKKQPMQAVKQMQEVMIRFMS